ncbi:hypothetical protein LMG28727_01317 [Paraburkholderia kirstenboschensis]|nr:hypothetical protein LMG28727_01317 [Paraburkholderia kirstenboschensis]
MNRTSQASFATLLHEHGHTDTLVARAQQQMETTLQQGFRLSDLAASLAVSERTLNRRFKEAVGLAPLTYLQNLRIEVAKRLLCRLWRYQHIPAIVQAQDRVVPERISNAVFACCSGTGRKRARQQTQLRPRLSPHRARTPVVSLHSPPHLCLYPKVSATDRERVELRLLTVARSLKCTAVRLRVPHGRGVVASARRLATIRRISVIIRHIPCLAPYETLTTALCNPGDSQRS